MLLDGLVDKKTYTTTMAEIETSILENEYLLEKYKENNVDIAESVTRILYFVGNLRNIIESSNVGDRRYIIGLLLSNSVITGKKCSFSLAKPFCKILENQGKRNWLESVSDFRTKDILELLTLGRKIDMLINR